MKKKNKELKEIRTVNHLGHIIYLKCEHDEMIPGLDADYCPVCNIYYINEQERERFYLRKKGIYE